MDQATLWLGLLMTLTMSILIAPRVLHLNQGKVLRNAAIWLAIVIGLALVYKIFGPFEMAMNQLPANSRAATEQPDEAGEGDHPRPKLNDDSGMAPKGDGGYTPPNE